MNIVQQLKSHELGKPVMIDATASKSCDDCRHQEEGRHYCLLHGVTVKNMDALRCRDFAYRLSMANVAISQPDAKPTNT